MIPTVALAMRAAFGPSPGSLLSCCLLFALWLPIGSAAANEVTDWSVIIEQTAIASSVKPGVILSGRNVSLMHLAQAQYPDRDVLNGGALTPAGRMGLELPGGASPPVFGTNNAYAATGRATASSCAQLYHSYDPATGTFLGYDGRRHACK